MTREIARNDVPAVIDVLRAGVADGTWDQETAKMYLRLQDDPTELMNAFLKACDEDPLIAAYVDNMSRR